MTPKEAKERYVREMVDHTAEKRLRDALSAARQAYETAMLPFRKALTAAQEAERQARRDGIRFSHRDRIELRAQTKQARKAYRAALALHKPIYLDAVRHARRRFESSARSQRPSNPPQTAKNLVCEPGEDCDHVYEVSTYSGEVEFSACVFCGYSPIK